MKAIAVLLLVATQASAATISLTADQASYVVGEAITLTVIGDAQGATAYGIYGRLVYDASLADTVSAVQTPVENWIAGPLSTGGGYAEVWNQIAGLQGGTADAPVVSTVVLQAQAPGTLAIDWTTDLDFFGVVGPTLRIEIACVIDCESPQPPDTPAVPEPSAALVFAIGIVSVALRIGRSRQASRR